jgi:hypothetical protein
MATFLLGVDLMCKATAWQKRYTFWMIGVMLRTFAGELTGPKL